MEDSLDLSSKKRKQPVVGNLRWKPEWSQCLIDYLVEAARNGQKVDKGFKSVTFSNAATHVSEVYLVPITPLNAYNHWRTLKNRWVNIQRCIIKLSGNGWDETKKMIILGETEAKDYIAANPKDSDFINRPIPNYDELAIICGSDHATGSFAKDNQEALGVTTPTIILDEMSMGYDENEGSQLPQNLAASGSMPGCSMSISQGSSKAKGKKKQPSSKSKKERDEDTFQAFFEVFKNSQARTKDVLDAERSESLIAALEQLEGYSEDHVVLALEYLSSNPPVGSTFLKMSMSMKQTWMRKFVERFG